MNAFEQTLAVAWAAFRQRAMANALADFRPVERGSFEAGWHARDAEVDRLREELVLARMASQDECRRRNSVGSQLAAAGDVIFQARKVASRDRRRHLPLQTALRTYDLHVRTAERHMQNGSH